MPIQNPPTWLQNTDDTGGYSANDDRLVIGAIITSSGVTSQGAFAVTQTSTASQSVNVAAGGAFVVGTDVADQGVYYVHNSGSELVEGNPGHPTLNRIDVLALIIDDSQYGGGTDTAYLDILPGVAASTPIAPGLPPTSIAIADILVSAGSSIITSAQIVDRRQPARLNGFMESSPTGVIHPYAGTLPTPGWLICDGSAVSRSTYSRLFASIGTTYGSGNGTTTFNVPDLRGRVPVGLDSTQSEFNSIGKVGGAKTHTLTVNEIAPHGHSIRGTSSPITSGLAFTPANESGTATSNRYHVANGVAAVSAQSTGGGQPHNNLQPYVSMNYIIKT